MSKDNLAITIANDQEIIAALKQSWKNPESGASTSEGEIFNDNLGKADLTTDTVERVNSYVTGFAAAANRAAGQTAAEALKANSEIESVTLKVGMGAFGEAAFKVSGASEVTIPGSGEKTTSYGSTFVKLDFVAGRGSGELGKGKNETKKLVAEALKKD